MLEIMISYLGIFGRARVKYGCTQGLYVVAGAGSAWGQNWALKPPAGRLAVLRGELYTTAPLPLLYTRAL
jgi:hypothetical protein